MTQQHCSARKDYQPWPQRVSSSGTCSDYQSVVLGTIDYGLGLTTISSTNLQKLDRAQNEAMRTILGTTKNTPIEAMLDVPSVSDRHKVAQVKAYLRAAENHQNPLHAAPKGTKRRSFTKRKILDGTSKLVCELSELKRVKEWTEIQYEAQHLCKINIAEHLGIAKMGCRKHRRRNKVHP